MDTGDYRMTDDNGPWYDGLIEEFDRVHRGPAIENRKSSQPSCLSPSTSPAPAPAGQIPMPIPIPVAMAPFFCDLGVFLPAAFSIGGPMWCTARRPWATCSPPSTS
ncbi:hypothetical protein ZWY2020_045726 [Hordeum vulgare]|nr:hypothetical protein ZWY2020_045726 [Hordeum vulgare]